MIGFSLREVKWKLMVEVLSFSLFSDRVLIQGVFMKHLKKEELPFSMTKSLAERVFEVLQRH